MSTAAYLASHTTCSIAERTVAGQDFGNWSFKAVSDMLTPVRTESSITDDCVLCYEKSEVLENSVDHYNTTAHEVAPARWVEILKRVRRKADSHVMTIREFMRELAGLGRHLGRKSDGEPGWITLWRGLEKLLLILRGADAELRRKCG